MPNKEEISPEMEKTINGLRRVVETLRADVAEDFRSILFRLERAEDTEKVALLMTELRRKMHDVRKQFERIEETAKELGGRL